MTPVLTEMTTDCVVCGEVACERDLLYVDIGDAIAGAETGDIVCRDCAGSKTETIGSKTETITGVMGGKWIGDVGAALDAGIRALDAVALDDGDYAYHAEETSSWYRVTESDVEELGASTLLGEADAYSHWCAGCGEEIRRAEFIDEDGCCRRCGNPSDGASGVGTCKSLAHQL